MNAGESGKPLRSESYVYTLGQPINIKTDFLSPCRQMAAPEISEMVVRFSGAVSGISGGALGRDAAKLVDNVSLRDDGEIVNASGAMLRLLEQMEIGNRQTDPADIASAATNTAYKYNLRILFGSDAQNRMLRPRDSALQIAQLLEGGNLTITTPAATPTGWQAAVGADWRIQVFVYARDGRKNELKARRRIWEVNIGQQEYDYQVNGFLRAALIGSKLTTTGYTSLAAFTTLFSRTLELPPQFESDMLLDEYRKTATALGTNDEFALATPGAIALKIPHRLQKIGQMIDCKTLHIDLRAAAPTNGRVLLDAVIPRSPVMGAVAMGFENPSALASAVRQSGVVQGEGGQIPVSHMLANLTRVLPVRLKDAG